MVTLPAALMDRNITPARSARITSNNPVLALNRSEFILWDTRHHMRQLLWRDTTRSAINPSTMIWKVKVTKTTVDVARWKS